MQEYRYLVVVSEVIRRAQRLLMHWDRSNNPNPKEDANKVINVDLEGFGKVINKLVEFQPSKVIKAVRARLKNSGSTLIDPVEFLKLMQKDWRGIINKRNQQVHRLDFAEAVAACQALVFGKQSDFNAAFGFVTELLFEKPM